MKVFVNQQEYETEVDTTLNDLMLRVAPNRQGIAVAVNQHVIAQACWNQHLLNPDDHILVIRAACGG